MVGRTSGTVNPTLRYLQASKSRGCLLEVGMLEGYGQLQEQHQQDDDDDCSITSRDGNRV